MIVPVSPRSVADGVPEIEVLPSNDSHWGKPETEIDGAGLPEIAQLLRHRSLLTTTIYAKVDQTALSTLALAWQGGEA